jgi:hypothetical protein
MVRFIKMASLPAIAMLLLAAASQAQKAPIAEQIAKTYGLDSWGQIDAIRYTFNIPARKVARTWTWEPKTGKVTYEGKDNAGNPVKVSYMRSQLDSQPENVKKEIDPGFINDQYWLILPFHLVWDTGATVEDKGMHKGLGPAGRAQVSLRRWVHARRHLGTLRWFGQSSSVHGFSSRRNRKAEPGTGKLGSL